jgi:SAM-dependent methyltransferase
MSSSDASTDELRAAHDVLAEVYAERLAGALDAMPIERAILGLFTELVTPGGTVGDIGCGTGRLAPFLAGRGLTPRGVDLSPEMVRVARRDHPGSTFDIADLRSLPFADAELDGVVCWYSLMYLAPVDRPAAYSELARVLKPGAPLAVAFKAGDGQHRRAGRTLNLGIEFDIWWHSPDDLRQALTDAGFSIKFWAGRPADGGEMQPQGYLVLGRQ